MRLNEKQLDLLETMFGMVFDALRADFSEAKSVIARDAILKSQCEIEELWAIIYTAHQEQRQ